MKEMGRMDGFEGKQSQAWGQGYRGPCWYGMKEKLKRLMEARKLGKVVYNKGVSGEGDHSTLLQFGK